MSNVGEDQKVAAECVEALFKAIPKSRQGNYIGELNEALVYIERHREARHEDARRKVPD